MKRDKLLRQISALPVGTDIGVRLGADYLDIVGLTAWGGGRFTALCCRPNDLRDFLKAWGVPAALRDELARSCPHERDGR